MVIFAPAPLLFFNCGHCFCPSPALNIIGNRLPETNNIYIWRHSISFDSDVLLPNALWIAESINRYKNNRKVEQIKFAMICIGTNGGVRVRRFGCLAGKSVTIRNTTHGKWEITHNKYDGVSLVLIRISFVFIGMATKCPQVRIIQIRIERALWIIWNWLC